MKSPKRKKTKTAPKGRAAAAASTDPGFNNDLCYKCGKGGDLICCDGCPRVYHVRCEPSLRKQGVPKGTWFCADCGSDSTKADYLSDPVRYPMSIRRPHPNGSGVALGRCLQQLELLCSTREFAKVGPVLRNHGFFRRQLAAEPRLWPATERDGVPLSTMLLLFHIGNAVGTDKVRQAVRLVEQTDALAAGYGTMGGRGDDAQMCRFCRRWRVLRTMCFVCGASHAENNGLPAPPVLPQHEAHLKRLRLRLQAAAVAAGPTATRRTAATAATRTELTSREVSLLSRWKLDAMLRGLTYFAECSREVGVFRYHGGDMLFLAHKLSVVVQQPPELKHAARRNLEELAERWMRLNTHVPADAEMEDLLNFVEALHVLKHLGYDDRKAHANAEGEGSQAAEASSEECVIDGNDVDGHQGAISADASAVAAPSSDALAHNGIAESVRSESDAPASSSVVELCCLNGDSTTEEQMHIHGGQHDNQPQPRRAKRSAGLEAAQRISAMAHMAAVDDHEYGGKRGKRSRKRELDGPANRLAHRCGNADYGRYKQEAFSFQRVISEVSDALMRFDLTDVLGFDPKLRKVPMTPAEHCSHCGMLNRKRAELCSECQHYLKSKVDYGSLTDAVVWAYVFKTLGIPFRCQLRSKSIDVSFEEDVVRMLPMARSYQTVDELGHDFFKLQCYFLTHFVYVMSDWGRHQLPRELFWEEFYFMLTNMRQVIKMDDAEIVGEFLHCLRILGVSSGGERDASYWPVVEQAVAYLLQAEYRTGNKGLWVKASDTVYARYHAAYTGVVGLIDFPRYPPEDTKPSALFLNVESLECVRD